MSDIAASPLKTPATLSFALNAVLLLVLFVTFMPANEGAANIRYCDKAPMPSNTMASANLGKVRQKAAANAVQQSAGVSRQKAHREVGSTPETKVSFIRCVPLGSNPES